MRDELPHELTAHHLGAVLAFHRRDYQESLARCRAILDWAPGAPLTWLLLARAESKLERFAEADRALEGFELLRSEPRFPELLEWLRLT